MAYKLYIERARTESAAAYRLQRFFYPGFGMRLLLPLAAWAASAGGTPSLSSARNNQTDHVP